MRADVAEQAAVLVGAVLLVLEIKRAPLAEDGEAEEYEQTDGPSVHELGPSRHFFDYTGWREAEARGSVPGVCRPGTTGLRYSSATLRIAFSWRSR